MVSPFPFAAGQILTYTEMNELEGLGASNTFGFTSGDYYGVSGTVSNANTPTLNRALFAPIYIPASTTFDRIAITSGTTVTGSFVARLGIYNNANGRPTTVVLDAGTVTATAPTTRYEITINQTITQGWYWLAFVVQTLTGTAQYQAVAANSSLFMSLTDGSFYQSSVTGALGTFSFSGRTSIPALISLRKS